MSDIRTDLVSSHRSVWPATVSVPALQSLLEASNDPALLVDVAGSQIVWRNRAADGQWTVSPETKWWPGLLTALRQMVAKPVAGDGSSARVYTSQIQAPSPHAESVEARIALLSENMALVLVPQTAIHYDCDRRDPLTELYDRSWLLDRMTTLLAGARSADHHFALLFIDLDGFKHINDRWGHLAGDHVLREVAARLKTSVRSGDTMVRFGGDEFIALLEGIHHAKEIQPIIERIEQALADAITLSGNDVFLTASIGTVANCDPFTTPLEIIEAADQAMYRNKHSNQVTSASGTGQFRD